MSLLRTKTIEQSIADTDEPEYQLKKRLTALDLTVFGIGVIIGAGIFTLTGRAAKLYAGPSIALSFVLAVLCYAEFASTVPVSGSRTRSRTSRSARSSPGSSAGTCCSNSCSGQASSRRAGRRTRRCSSMR
jgi:amino acid permease